MQKSIVIANEVTQSMTSKEMDRHATLAMTVLFHNADVALDSCKLAAIMLA
jgi:hypothetical protein